MAETVKDSIYYAWVAGTIRTQDSIWKIPVSTRQSKNVTKHPLVPIF